VVSGGPYHRGDWGGGELEVKFARGGGQTRQEIKRVRVGQAPSKGKLRCDVVRLRRETRLERSVGHGLREEEKSLRKKAGGKEDP